MATTPGAADVVIVMPVFDDWPALESVLRDLDAELARSGRRADVLIADDGSPSPPVARPRGGASEALGRVEVLRLRRNVGHQRAIAIALAFLQEHRTYRSVLVMDADGEDRPADVPRLLDRLEQETPPRVVFAERVRRSESLAFAAGYHAYRLLHRILTGVAVRVGNFSALSFDALPRLVCMSEMWNHFAAAVFRSRIPYVMVPTARGRRAVGRSTMNLVTLTAHGLSAISVFGDIVGVRLLIGTLAAAGLSAVGWATGLVSSRGAECGWAVLTLGLFLISIQTALACVLFLFVVQASRSSSSFLLARDYRYFVLEDPRPFYST